MKKEGKRIRGDVMTEAVYVLSVGTLKNHCKILISLVSCEKSAVSVAVPLNVIGFFSPWLLLR